MARRNIIGLILALCLILSGCSASAPPSDAGKYRIVTTIFPVYDWLREIVGEQNDQVELTLLTERGQDIHNYQASVRDLVKIAHCDLFVYVGGESDVWVEDALESVPNPDRQVVCLMDELGDRVHAEEEVEGMQEARGEEEDEAADEHVWLSLKNAGLLCTSLAETLVKADPERGETYRANAAVYEEKLRALDEAYEDTVSKAARRTILFADRFPFRYLTEDYGLAYYAAFAGCSAEAEASFETIVFLSGKTEELGLPVILILEGSDGKLARTVSQNTRSADQEILSMHSLQSVTREEIEAGSSYLSLMEYDLEILKKALN